MLACQRSLFELPNDIAYLNGAAFSPIPHSVRQAGETGIGLKAAPWRITWPPNAGLVEEARRLAASLINATANDIAIGGAASYGIATACANLSARPGERVLVLGAEHASLALGLARFAEEHGAVLEAVPRPADYDYTATILAAIARPGAARVALAGLSPSHWSDGTAIDLLPVATALRRQGAGLIVDATQAAGVTALDVAVLDPDFVLMPSYKWLLGPYGLAFLYAAPRHHEGRPLEEHGANRTAYDSALAAPASSFAMLPGARRFDRGERDVFITLPMAHAGLELVTGWGQEAIGARLRLLTDRLADRLEAIGLKPAPRRFRVPHILGLALAPEQRDGLVAAAEAAGIFVAIRQAMLRVSPGVYNDEADIDRFANWLEHWLRR
jgi:selenocysteine lyase/cysteine desulfurase